jgi:hypothetical protein
MSRCICCNIPLVWRDVTVLKEDGTEEDLCSECLGVALNPDVCDFRTYQFEDITETVDVS